MKYLIYIVKGLFIGASMLVPGVSGGTMAVILGIYDELLTAVNHFFSAVKKHLLLFLTFCGGAFVGIFLFADVILKLTERYRMPMLFLFLGAILGGVPALFQKAAVKKFDWRYCLYILAGIVVVSLFDLIPANLLDIQGANPFLYCLLLVVAGLLAAIALILPGISISYMLLILGIYEKTMLAISTFDFFFLLPMAVGMVVGTLLIARALEKAMNHYPTITYLMIVGFLLGSLPGVFPGIPSGLEWLYCLLALGGGFAVMWLLSRLTSRS